MHDVGRTIADRIDGSENTLLSSIQKTETKLQENARTVTDSLTVTMDEHFAALSKSTSSQAERIELSVANVRESLSQELQMSCQSMADDIRQQLRQQLEALSILHTSSHLVSAVSPQELLSPRPRRRRKQQIFTEASPMCTCGAETTTTVFRPQWRWFPRTSEVALVHDRKCPLWYVSRRKAAFEINIRVHRLLVTGGLVFSGGYYSWRDWSVAPSRSLRCCVTVPSDSGAFAILEELGKRVYKIELVDKPADPTPGLQHALELCLADLRQAFATGIASPYDVDEKGRSILQASSLLI